MTERSECRIKTPEGVIFRLFPAGLPTRMLALIVDTMMVAAVIIVVNQLVILCAMLGSFAWVQGIQLIVDFCIGMAYWIVLEWVWNGRTVGKKLFRLRVVDSNGLKLIPRQLVVRNLLRSVDFLPVFYMVGSICAFIDPKGRRLGDIAAGTMVVQELTPGQPDLSSVLPDKYNSLRDFPVECARLREAVTPEESCILLDALVRRDTLSADARCEIYAELAELVRKKVDLPQAALDGVSDENFLRNVIDILYKT